MSVLTEVSNYKKGCFSLQKKVNNLLKRISEDPTNAFISVLDEFAIRQSEQIDSKRKIGKPLGKLAGTVVAVKDNMVMKEGKTTAGSKILESFISPYDATVIRKLYAEDAVIIGKTNMDEFGMGSLSDNPVYGAVKHPSDLSLVPGGSSGGSAVAVQKQYADFALGSDTGGSIRQPAAFTGIVGLKPTYGQISRYGLISFASSFDQIGPLAKSVADVSYILPHLCGKDLKDSTSTDSSLPDLTDYLNKDIKGMVIGYPEKYIRGNVSPKIEETILLVLKKLEKAGARIEVISIPYVEYAVALYYILANAEASSNLRRYDGLRYGLRSFNGHIQESRSTGFSEEVKRRILIGTFVLSSKNYAFYYQQAMKVRKLLHGSFKEQFTHVDTILTPTVPVTVFKRDEIPEDPLQIYLSDLFTVTANLTGMCGISIPVATEKEEFPIGIQLLADHFKEENLIRAGHRIEQFSCKFEH